MAVGSTPRDSGNIPLGCVGVPGDTTPQQLQGGKEYTDANSNITAPGVFCLSDGWKATYVYSAQTGTPVATATDVVVLRGSATKTIRVTRIELSGQATAATEIILLLKKHTIANTGGTSSTPVPTKYDSNDGTATATVLLYTANPTVDASATIFRVVRLTLAVAPAATANLNDRYLLDLGARPAEALVLRGVAQELAVNLNGVAVPAGENLDVTIEWTEE